MSSISDAEVIRQALSTHLSYLRTIEAQHRSTAQALARHPDLTTGAGHYITLSAAHRARCVSYAQRADFMDELSAFPISGLATLTGEDMRSLYVAAHIGVSALSPELSASLASRQAQLRRAAAHPETHPLPPPPPEATAETEGSALAGAAQTEAEHLGQPAPAERRIRRRGSPRRTLLDVLYGREASPAPPRDRDAST